MEVKAREAGENQKHAPMGVLLVFERGRAGQHQKRVHMDAFLVLAWRGWVGVKKPTSVSKHRMEGFCWSQKSSVSCFDMTVGQGWSKTPHRCVETRGGGVVGTGRQCRCRTEETRHTGAFFLFGGWKDVSVGLGTCQWGLGTCRLGWGCIGGGGNVLGGVYQSVKH